MLFSKLLSRLNNLNLPIDQFVVVSSGSLAVRNIREAQDLDILVTTALWNDLIKKHPVNTESGITKIIADEYIEILGQDSLFNDPKIAAINEVLQTADIINGIKFINLKLLRKFKEKMGREKDKKDIELIDTYLGLNV